MPETVLLPSPCLGTGSSSGQKVQEATKTYIFIYKEHKQQQQQANCDTVPRHNQGEQHTEQWGRIGQQQGQQQMQQHCDTCQYQSDNQPQGTSKMWQDIRAKDQKSSFLCCLDRTGVANNLFPLPLRKIHLYVHPYLQIASQRTHLYLSISVSSYSDPQNPHHPRS